MTTVHSNPPARHAPPHVQAGPATRRVGYAVAVAVNAVMLYLVNRSPGWEALPFLTPETTEVLGLVNASIVAGVVANLVYLAWDPPWVRALGDVVTTSIGLTALVQIWQVWPIDLDSGWTLVARWVIGIGIVGSVIGIIGALVRLGRSLSASPSVPGDQPPASGTTRHA
ncbi:hypothetical protein GCM10023168_36310 [Fodinibacter luteus]|uniref:Uncharacterized protein n=1 Tax=Fodinibacter luteus TaxID=552064 RepID=A0ABP8KS02_9MICO